MTEGDRRAIARFVSAGRSSSSASVDDLQGLLLQVSLALLMIFMIAYFMFVAKTEKEQREAVMDINRQKLELALEKVSEDMRIRYGLNALMTQGVDGRRVFEPDGHFDGARLQLSPAARTAFGKGSRAASTDYEDIGALVSKWNGEVLAAADIAEESLSPEEKTWLRERIVHGVEDVRLDVRGVQRSLAARLQRRWVENPAELSGIDDAGEIADALKKMSTELLEKETGGRLLR